MDTTSIISVIVAAFGGGGLAALITAILSAKTHRSEADKVEQEAEQIRSQTTINEMDFINKRLQEISDKFRAESAELIKRNNEMSNEIARLNNNSQLVMEWIIYENQNYRQWLETELRKVNPDIVFPECPPPPKIFAAMKSARDSRGNDTNDDK